MKEIGLTRGEVALVDEEDYSRVVALGSWYCMCARQRKYALHKNPDGSATLMHRFILGLGRDQGIWVDHILGNGLDNRRSNLRLCTPQENFRNRPKNSNNLGPYKGVRIGHKGVFTARIGVGGIVRHIGTFSTAELAAEAYNKAALELHGEFASLNEIRIKK